MNKHLLVPGISNELFEKLDGVPITKEEIRVLVLSKLQLFSEAVLYDIGSGSGSIAIESKLIDPKIEVYAVEKNPNGIKAIEKNCNKFGVDINTIQGSAPDALLDLPPADRIFIGGSGGNLIDILNLCDIKLKPGGQIVLNSVTMNTGPQAVSFWQEKSYKWQAATVNISITSSDKKALIWEARNPVTIITAEKEES
ncbi:Cobalt-precorrin-6B C15-methyltransferase [decarboxylating] [Candidatus Syntrophocurvum alkaliphilum]|uniref:Cobalt-precorrin-6B C15-methyltransferase [decarboxylating] n=1 Tax=Candidatus Syntrophocurvum alkaliphilum TaxID=2293317 RepID=A0A6I6DMG3_9FIRM|nr:precorrin-6Y C5,15-methyltransferase (decarboxylating) subunit CbiT [Candidatus Syntrophocurvum alkaliphilum]QGU00252.1 Cobalt-precorrin-6B C15-methyltransferase [decarboxylating] [Candidatus Syntrophocurvum alkaliphilum]